MLDCRDAQPCAEWDLAVAASTYQAAILGIAAVLAAPSSYDDQIVRRLGRDFPSAELLELHKRFEARRREPARRLVGEIAPPRAFASSARTPLAITSSQSECPRPRRCRMTKRTTTTGTTRKAAKKTTKTKARATTAKRATAKPENPKRPRAPPSPRAGDDDRSPLQGDGRPRAGAGRRFHLRGRALPIAHRDRQSRDRVPDHLGACVLPASQAEATGAEGRGGRGVIGRTRWARSTGVALAAPALV